MCSCQTQVSYKKQHSVIIEVSDCSTELVS